MRKDCLIEAADGQTVLDNYSEPDAIDDMVTVIMLHF
jgi:hypothetical protein